MHSYSGDVMKFAGDAMIIAFYPDPTEVRNPDEGLEAAVSRCAQCACELSRCLGHMRMLPNGDVQPISHPEFIAMQLLEAEKSQCNAKIEQTAMALQDSQSQSGILSSKSEKGLNWLANRSQSKRGRDGPPKVLVRFCGGLSLLFW